MVKRAFCCSVCALLHIFKTVVFCSHSNHRKHYSKNNCVVVLARFCQVNKSRQFTASSDQFIQLLCLEQDCGQWVMVTGPGVWQATITAHKQKVSRAQYSSSFALRWYLLYDSWTWLILFCTYTASFIIHTSGLKLPACGLIAAHETVFCGSLQAVLANNAT